MIRTFVAIPANGLSSLENWVEQMRLKSFFQDIRWTNPGDWHITLHFIGNVEEQLLPHLSASLSSSLQLHPLGIAKVKGAGYFGRPGHPRVLWAGVQESAWLTKLYQLVQEGIEEAGLPPAAKSFTPHLTLGRNKWAPNSPLLVDELEKQASFFWGELEVKEVILLKSGLTEHGPAYSVLEKFPLKP